jgi:TrmH family RNA methyltransferase
MPSAYERALDLTRPARRRAAGRFLAEGPHVVADALAAGAAVEDLFVAFEAADRAETIDIASRAAEKGAQVHRLAARQLEQLADTETPQGLIAVVRMPAAPEQPFARPGTWLLLDGVQDPGNVGTLLRSAEAFGAVGVAAGPGTADLWSGKVLRSAQGAHFRLVLLGAAGEGEVARTIDAFVAAGGVLWAGTRDGENVFRTPQAPERTMLALGSEARGLSDDVLMRAARRVAVPQRGRADSLNVAMAGSVLLAWMAEPRP